MFRAHKEIIWHLTCEKCKTYFTIATMEENYSVDKSSFYCIGCGTKQKVLAQFGEK